MGLSTALLALGTACGSGSETAPSATETRAAPPAPPGGDSSGGTSLTAQVATNLKEAAQLVDWQGHGIGRRVGDLELTGTEGPAGLLSDQMGDKALVVSFRDFECPVSKRIGGELRRMEQHYSGRGVAFLFVYPGTAESAAQVAEDVAAFGLEGTYVLDPDEELVRALGARTTTDAFVLDRGMTLVYRGAISDRVGRGFQKDKARFEYLPDALDAVLLDREVEVKATSAPGCFLGVEFPEEDVAFEPGEVTWHDQVSRIVQQRCATCHHDGGQAPFDLVEMRDLTKRKGMIEFVVEEGVMPPWPTTAETGPWRNDLSLSDWQRAALLSWLENDCPEGDPAHAPAPRVFPTEWEIGTPDLVFPMAEEQVVPAEGDGSYRWIETTMKVPEDLWVAAIEVRSSAPEVVHHTIIEVKWPEGSRVPYQKNYFDRNFEKKRGLDRFFFIAGPGSNSSAYPEGTAAFVPKGAEFVFQTHYTPSGVETRDVSELGLVLADEPPKMVAISRIPQRTDLDIAPNASGVEYSVVYHFEHDAMLLSLAPHMHLRGTECVVDLIHADGTSERLIDIPAWDLDWNIRYRFLNGRLIQAGSKLKMDGLFDNSAANPENPDPSQRVRFGQLTRDEMLLLVVDTIEPLRRR